MKTVYFHLWFLCKSDFRIFCLETMEKLSELNTFQPKKNDIILYIIRLRFQG